MDYDGSGCIDTVTLGNGLTISAREDQKASDSNDLISPTYVLEYRALLCTSEMTTTILVDDFDSRVQFHGSGWSTGGDPILEYGGTTHYTPQKGDSFSFAFNGTRVGVYGTVRNNATLSVQCSLDGTSSTRRVNPDVSPPSTTDGSISYQLLFCDGVVSDDREHNLIVAATEDAPTSDHLLFFDYISYEIAEGSRSDPVPRDVDQDSVDVAVSALESEMVSFLPGEAWTRKDVQFASLQNSTQGTSNSGSRAEFRFIGTKAAVYGTVEPDGLDSTTTYQVDGGSQTTIHTSKYSNQPLPLRYTKFYESSSLSDGIHTLVVIYTGGSSMFWLDYFTYTPSMSLNRGSTPDVVFSSVVPLDPSGSPTAGLPRSSAQATNSEQPQKGGSPTSSTQPSVSGSEQPKKAGQMSTGVIAGCIVGVNAALALLAAVAIIMIKRRKRRTSISQAHQIYEQALPNTPPLEIPRSAHDGSSRSSLSHPTTSHLSTPLTPSCLACHPRSSVPSATALHQSESSKLDGGAVTRASTRSMRDGRDDDISVAGFTDYYGSQRTETRPPSYTSS